MNIPALIAAIAFALLVFFLALPLYKLGKVFDELRTTIEKISENANQTLAETTKTVQGANAQLDKVDAITTSTAQIAQDVSALSTLMSSTVATPFIKISAFSQAARKMLAGKKEDNENVD